MEDKKALEAIQNIGLWFEKNSNWLTEWLTNVVIVPEEEAKMSGKVYQSFVVPVQSPKIESVISSLAVMKFNILKHTVFGKERKSTIISPTSAQAKPSMFGGFIEIVKRAPKEGDVALYTAYEWSLVLNQSGRFFLRTICTVDFLYQT